MIGPWLFRAPAAEALGLGFKIVVLGGQGGGVMLRLLLCLLDRLVSIELVEPGSDPACQRSVLLRGDHRDLASLLRGFVIFAHRSFVRGQFILNLRAVIAGGALEILAARRRVHRSRGRVAPLRLRDHR